MINSSQEKVSDKKKRRQDTRRQHRYRHQPQHLPVAGAQVTRGALDVDLVVAHLGVNDGETQR